MSTGEHETGEPAASQPSVAPSPSASVPASPPSLSFQILRNLLEYAEAQKADLRLLNLVDEREGVFNDSKSHALEELRHRYPSLTDAQREQLMDGILEVASRDRGDFEAPGGVQGVMRSIADLLAPYKDQYHQGQLLTDVVRASIIPPSSPRMRGSVFTGIEAMFEVFVTGLASTVARAEPSKVLSDDRSISWGLVAASPSIESLQAALVDDVVGGLLRGPMDKWLEFFHTKFNIRVPKMTAELWEVILRRHAFVHAGGKASPEYVRRLKEAGGPEVLIGSDLAVSSEYVRRAADLFIYLAFTLSANAIVALGSDEERPDVEELLINVPYRLLQDQRLEAVRMICGEYRNASFKRRSSKNVMLVNYWLSCRGLGRFEEVRMEVLEWDVSAEGARFVLARHALLGEVAEGWEVAKTIRGSSELREHHWLTWPLLEEIRAYAGSLQG